MANVSQTGTKHSDVLSLISQIIESCNSTAHCDKQSSNLMKLCKTLGKKSLGNYLNQFLKINEQLVSVGLLMLVEAK